jgi:hypothetical protein
MDMKFTVRASILAALAGAWLGPLSATTPAAAAECGTADHPPCADRAKSPKPAAPKSTAKKIPNPQHDAAPQRNDTPQREPRRTATPRPDDAPREWLRDDNDKPSPAAAAVDVKLSKIPDIIVPEPKAEVEPDETADELEPDADVDVEAPPLPPSRPVQAPPRPQAPPAYSVRHGAE